MCVEDFCSTDQSHVRWVVRQKSRYYCLGGLDSFRHLWPGWTYFRHLQYVVVTISSYVSSQLIEVKRIVSLIFVFGWLLFVLKLSVLQRVLLSFLRFYVLLVARRVYLLISVAMLALIEKRSRAKLTLLLRRGRLIRHLWGGLDW